MNVIVGNISINAGGNPAETNFAVEIFDDSTQHGILIPASKIATVLKALTAISLLVDIGTKE